VVILAAFVFLVENYPRYSDRLPDNLLEVEHRVRDIMFCDKTLHNKKLAKAITYYLKFIDELYHAVEDRFDLGNTQDKEMKRSQIFMKMQTFQ
jgi:NTE family protein